MIDVAQRTSASAHKTTAGRSFQDSPFSPINPDLSLHEEEKFQRNSVLQLEFGGFNPEAGLSLGLIQLYKLKERTSLLIRDMAGSTALALYIALSCLAFVTSKIIVSCLLYRRWTRKRSIVQDTLSGGKFVLFRSSTTHSLNSKVFVKKTMKLSNKDIIGSGGQGTVYRLTINDTAAFAVKRLSKGNSDVDRGFERELDAMGDIKHRNIVTLHGYYVSPHFNFLVYELMPNGSLDSLLHGNSRKVLEPLDWATRYKIAIGAARGISYLHHDCIPHIIHRDIKSSNILLDHNMEARVSDFGLAALLEPSRTHITTIVAGSFGYLAPEYFDTGRATTKGDVYSFGVVLLELLTGKRPTDESFLEGGTKLVTWVKGIIEVNEEQHAIDKALTCYPIEEVKRVFHVAEKCLEPDPSERPTMAEVLKMLEQIKTSNTPTVP